MREPISAEHILTLLQIVWAVMGVIGWHPQYGEFWEPVVNIKWLQKSVSSFWAEVGKTEELKRLNFPGRGRIFFCRSVDANPSEPIYVASSCCLLCCRGDFH